MKHQTECLLLLLFLPLLNAQDLWRAEFNNTLTEKNARKASVTGKLPGGETREFRLKNDCADMDLVREKRGKSGDCAIILNSFFSEKDEMRAMGIGADWWFTLFLNGKLIKTTGKGGNGFTPIGVDNYRINLPVKKGKNHLAVFLRRGSNGWIFAFGKQVNLENWPTKPEDQRRFFHRMFSRKPQIEHGPWFVKTTQESVRIGVLLTWDGALGIRWKIKGSKESWRRQDSMIAGQKELSRRHIFQLENLRSGSEYQYELLLLDMDTGLETPLGEGTFKTHPDKADSYAFFAVSDMQVPDKDRVEALKSMLNRCGMRQGNFFVSLGDVADEFNQFNFIYFDSFLDVLEKNGWHVPFVPVRGNHEYRGLQTDEYARDFGTPYYAFRYGKDFYFVLDTGDDQPPSPHSRYTRRTATDSYLAEQAEWLKKTATSPECRNARYRIVLAHATPFKWQSEYYYTGIKKIAGSVFFGEKPLCKLDLWLCGDVHSPYRFDPLTKTITGAAGGKKLPDMTAEDLANIRFPVYVNDGPNGAGLMLTVMRVDINEKGITLANISPDGEIQDQVILRRNMPALVHQTKFKKLYPISQIE